MNHHGRPSRHSPPPSMSAAGASLLILLNLFLVAHGQTQAPAARNSTTTPAPVPTLNTFEPTVDTNFPSITPYPTTSPTVTAGPTLTRSPTFSPTITSWPTSRTISPTLSLYPTQSSGNNNNTGGGGGGKNGTTCSLCDAGETMETPGKEIPPYSADFTCADLNAELENAGAATSRASCEALIQQVNPTLAFLEMQAFCGCTGSRPPKLCTFCDQDTYLPEANYLTVVEVPGMGNVTCEQAAAFTDYIRNEDNCMDWSLALTDPCCVKGSAAPAQAPSSPAAPSAPSAPTAPSAPSAPTSTSGGTAVAGGRSVVAFGATILGMATAMALLS